MKSKKVKRQSDIRILSKIKSHEKLGCCKTSMYYKRFLNVTANDRIDFALREEEIHAPLGENGAGKSTLMNILSGLYRPDSGKIFVREGSNKVGNHFTVSKKERGEREWIGCFFKKKAKRRKNLFLCLRVFGHVWEDPSPAVRWVLEVEEQR